MTDSATVEINAMKKAGLILLGSLGLIGAGTYAFAAMAAEVEAGKKTNQQQDARLTDAEKERTDMRIRQQLTEQEMKQLGEKLGKIEFFTDEMYKLMLEQRAKKGE